MSDQDLIPLQNEPETAGFDIVLRGYDRRQVENYVERVELALADADRQHDDDGERLAALEAELLSLQQRVMEAEERAAGLPEPASRVGERLATMLVLAEDEAEQIVTQARERAAMSTAERTAELDRREDDVYGATAAAEQSRLDAQRDVEALRARAQQEAEAMQADANRQADALLAQAAEQAALNKQTAEEDVVIIREEGRALAEQERAAAQQQVDDLARQRDAIAAQLQALRETLSAAIQPLTLPPAP